MSRKIYNDYLPEIERVVPTQEELIASGYKFSAKNEEMEKRRAYYEANKDKIAEQKKAYREANRGKVAEMAKAYREANKARISSTKTEEV